MRDQFRCLAVIGRRVPALWSARRRSLTNDGRPKRWVVVRPPGAQTGLLRARADGERQSATVGHQVAGRVGFFLRVDDFDAAYRRMTEAGVTFVRPPRAEPYGRVAVFLDIAGNRWDPLGTGLGGEDEANDLEPYASYEPNRIAEKRRIRVRLATFPRKGDGSAEGGWE